MVDFPQIEHNKLGFMTTKMFIPYARQSIDQADIEAVTKALQDDIITRGPGVEAFEDATARYCDASYAVAFNSGTSALFAACYAAGLGVNDRVISTPNTFASTVGAAARFGASPVFIDIDRNTGNFDLALVEHNLNIPSTRGRTVVMPVHFGGIPVDMRRLDEMIRNPDTIVIEDAAHALGSRYPSGEKVGSCVWSQLTVFSFHPAKTITTGEGGMVTTNDEELYRKLLLYRNNGIERDPRHLQGDPAPWYYEVQEISGNYNFTEFQAALGLSQLNKIESFINKRRQLVAEYRRLLEGMPHVRLFTSEHDASTAFHLFVVQIDFKALKTTRSLVMEKLKDRGIGTQYHYIPIYRHPAFKRGAGDIWEYFPNMEGYYAEALSLPLYYNLSLEEVAHVVAELKASL